MIRTLRRSPLGIGLGFILSACTGIGAKAADLATPLNVTPLGEVSPGTILQEQRPGLFRLAVFEFFPRVSASGYYDDNLTIQRTNEIDDLVWSVSPGISVVALESSESAGIPGKSVTIEYSPSFVFYSDHDEYNAINHMANLSALWPMAKLTLGVSQSYSKSESGVIDVGDRIGSTAYSTALTSSYQLSEKTSFQVNAGLTISEYDARGTNDYNGSRTFSNSDWFNYHVTTKISLGLGVTLGYVDPESKLTPNQTYEQALVRLVYILTDKVNFSASGGAEWRQYQGSTGAPDSLVPIFNVAGTYLPFEGTTITLEGHRQYQVSAVFLDQNMINTGASLALRQRLFEKLAVSVVGGYDNADYRPAVAGAGASRSDNFYTARVALDISIRERWTAGIFYQHRKNNSNDPLFDFTNNLFGLQTSWSF